MYFPHIYTDGSFVFETVPSDGKWRNLISFLNGERKERDKSKKGEEEKWRGIEGTKLLSFKFQLEIYASDGSSGPWHHVTLVGKV
jgi:hypothetical protein